jgi:hypothetical protein
MNRLCPICKRPFVKQDGLLYCAECRFYAKPDLSSPSYSDDYILHYKLYEKTPRSWEICKERWRFIEVNIDLENKVLLDFGCGAGTFVKHRKNQKISYPKTYAYDPYFNVDHSFVEDEIDIVTFWDSLEHMGRLSIIPLLNAEHIFLCLPIIDDVQDITVWKHFVPHEHLWYFSTQALHKLFSAWKYEMIVRASIEGHLRSPDIISFYFRRKTP